MEAEAKRIKLSAEYQSQIQETLQRMASKDSLEESEYEDDDISDYSEPPYLKEHLVDDSPEEEITQNDQLPLTPIEATAKLSKFRPVISKPSDLKYLLECKADPNMPVATGNITPLKNIMSFASTPHVVQMRNLLLEYGAKESEQEKAWWELRQSADRAELIRINNERSIINKRGYIQWSAGGME